MRDKGTMREHRERAQARQASMAEDAGGRREPILQARGRAALGTVLLLASIVMGQGVAKATDTQLQTPRLTGQLLVASPAMRDPRFFQTVIYIVRHDANGALGLVVNRPIGDAPLARLLEQFGIESNGASGNIQVHYGGPVGGAWAFVLHTADYIGKGTLLINNAMALTSTPQILRDIAVGTGPRRILFALGYAGWAPGQLDGEIEAGDWVTVPANEALVFDDDVGKWQRAMDRRLLDL